MTNAATFLRYTKLNEENLAMPAADSSRAQNVTWAKGLNQLDDIQLMAKIADGDASSLEVLYDRHSSAVMGLCLKMLNDRAAAEEIVQEAFWRVWRNADSFRKQRGSPVSWLFGIARNLCIDYWRRHKIRPQPAFADEEDGTEIVSSHNVDESVWLSIKHKQVRQAMADLPQPQRRVIELAYFWGMTRQEIAETVDVPLGTVNTRARLAMQKLREFLAGQGFEE